MHCLLDASLVGSLVGRMEAFHAGGEQLPCQSKHTKPLLAFPKEPRAPGMLLSVWWEEVLSKVGGGYRKRD